MSDSPTLQQSNGQRLRALAEQGVQVNTEGLALKVLIDLMPEEQRKAWSETYERELEELLVQAEQQVARMKLQVGAIGGADALSLASINRDKPLGG
jgi:hypothetical protein